MNYDIFILVETHVVESAFDKYKKYFNGFELHWVPATRTSRFGRASGGCLYGYKKQCLCNDVRIVFENDCSVDFIRIAIRDSCTHILPVYLNRKNWDNDFMKIQNLFIQNCPDKFIIVGDCNGRIASLNALPDELVGQHNYLSQHRDSKDLVIDSNGRKLLEWLEEIGGVVLNGRTPSDKRGEMTFAGSMGSSVNDLGIISFSMAEDIVDFRVVDQNFSDHFPIEISMNTGRVVSEVQEIALLPKLHWLQNNKAVVQQKIRSSVTSFVHTGDSENDLLFLIESIKQAVGQNGQKQIKKSTFRQKWFDWECFKARKESFKQLAKLRRQSTMNVSDCESARESYVRANACYKKICKEKQEKYEAELGGKLLAVKDSKGWWEIANEIRNKPWIKGNNLDITDLKVHFQTILNPVTNIGAFSYAEPFRQIESLDIDFSIGELSGVLCRAKNNKAPGMDRIPNEYFKNAPTEFLEKLLTVYNNIYSGSIPSGFKKSIIFPLFKKGDPSDAANYRGISFMDSVAKIFCAMLLERLNMWIEGKHILCENQAGFRRHYGTVDHIFTLFSLIKLRFVKKKKLYVFFVDFKTAFDSISRNALFYKLYALGLSSKFIKTIKNMYEGSCSAVWDGERLSDWFHTNSGVKQGCVLSPALFALFINDLPSYVGGGTTVGETVINVLMFADDIALMAESPIELQDMIKNLEEYCQLWGFNINLLKSKIMIFNNGGGRRARNEIWYMHSQEVEVVKNYKYLGIIMTPKLSLHPQLKERLIMAKNSINLTWCNLMRKKDILPSTKFKVFDCVARSVLCYGAQVWGFKSYDLVENLQRFFVKKIFGLPKTTPKYMIQLETGLPNLWIYTLKLHIMYVQNVLKLPAQRFPKIVANECRKEKAFWMPEWENLAISLGFEFNIENVCAGIRLNSILDSLHNKIMHDAKGIAIGGVRHDLYPELDYSVGNSYISDGNRLDKIRLTFKARGGMLPLNDNPAMNAARHLCSLCNLEEPENVTHFLGICPIFNNLRLRLFGAREISRYEVKEILNGRNWDALNEFLIQALKYRQLLIEEFNH